MYPSSIFCSYSSGRLAVTSRRSAAGFFLQFSFQFSFEKRRFRWISRTADFGRLVPLPLQAALRWAGRSVRTLFQLP